MNKAISVVLAIFGALCVAGLFQPQWNPITVILLIGIAATCGWFSVKFWKKPDANRT